MGLFSLLTENGRGCVALVARDKLIYEVKYTFSVRKFSVFHFYSI